MQIVSETIVATIIGLHDDWSSNLSLLGMSVNPNTLSRSVVLESSIKTSLGCLNGRQKIQQSAHIRHGLVVQDDEL